MGTNKLSGIYKIVNKINNKIYVGKSKDVKTRLAVHKSKLKMNRHINKHLQYAWNIYGGENFEFCIIEICEEEQLSEKEIYWIIELKSSNPDFGYNIINSNHDIKENKNSHKGKITKTTIYNCEHCGKETTMFTSKYNDSKSHYCSHECARYGHRNQINTICEECGTEYYISVSSYNIANHHFCSNHCRIENKKGKKLSEKHKNSLKRETGFEICQINLFGELVCIFRTAEEAGKSIGKPASSISKSAKGNRHFNIAYGYIWVLKKDYEKENIEEIINNRIKNIPRRRYRNA